MKTIRRQITFLFSNGAPLSFSFKPAIFFPLFFLSLFIGKSIVAQLPYDSIAIQISNRVITLNEIRILTLETEQQFKQQNAPVPDKVTLTKEVVTNLIGNALYDLEADRFNLKVTSEQLDSEVNNFLKRNRMDNATFEEFLKNRQISSTSFKKSLIDRIRRSQVQGNFVRGKVSIDEDELIEYFEKQDQNEYVYTISHILRSVPPESTDLEWGKATEEIEYIMDQLDSGAEDFERLVLDYSQDPSAKTNKGQLAPFSKGEVIPELEEAVLTMEAGEIRSSVKTRFGMHLIRLDKKEGKEKKVFEDVKNEIHDRLLRKKLSLRQAEFIEELKKRYPIIYRNEQVGKIMKDTAESG